MIPNTFWRIRRAENIDLPAVLRLYDEAVRWLVEHNLAKQWGETPVSARPHLIDEIQSYFGPEYLAAIAETSEGNFLGFIALEFPPAADDTAIAQVHSIVTSRSPIARGVGADLLRWAEEQAKKQGSTALRLNCWAGNPKLVHYYEQRGFLRCGEPEKDIQVQEFEKPLLITSNN